MPSLSLGRYVPYRSPIHSLDPRTKLFCLVLLIVTVFLGYANYSTTFLMAGVSLILVLALFFMTRMRFTSLLKSLKSLWFMLIFLLLIYAIMPRSDNLDWVAFFIGDYPIYWASILDALKILVRLMLMVALSLILTASTKPLDLTAGFEWYLTPIRWLGVNTAAWSMVLSLALRFIPTILVDVERIMKAQSSRGVDFQRGKLNVRARALVSLIVPLVVSSLMRSDELADAMEGRGYDPRAKRTRYRKLSFHWGDLIALLLVGAFFGVCVTMSALSFDPFLSWFKVAVR